MFTRAGYKTQNCQKNENLKVIDTEDTYLGRHDA